MPHMSSRCRMQSPKVFLTFTLSLSALTCYVSMFTLAGSSMADQLVALGHEKAQLQSLNRGKSPTEKNQTQTRKSHRLIRKSPLGSAQIEDVTRIPTTTTGQTTTIDGTTLKKEAAVVPTTSTTQTTQTVSTSTTTTSLVPIGALSSPTTSTLSSSSNLSGIAAAGSSTLGTSATGGRGIKQLSKSMPGLNELVTPTTTSATPVSSTPSIARNPTVLSFSAVQGGANPPSQSVTISNSGSGTLSWTATSSIGWLTINGGSAASGANNGSFGVGTNISGLAIGTYTGTIAITGTGATNTPQTVAVTLAITAAPTPTIGVSATSISFTGVQGGSNPSPQTLAINNTGAGTLNWSVSENAPWLTPSVLSGSGAGSIVLSITSAGMSAGTYSTPLTISASGATNTPQTVMVTLSLTAPATPTIIFSPTALTFSAAQGGSNPTAQTVSIEQLRNGNIELECIQHSIVAFDLPRLWYRTWILHRHGECLRAFSGDTYRLYQPGRSWGHEFTADDSSLLHCRSTLPHVDGRPYKLGVHRYAGIGQSGQSVSHHYFQRILECHRSAQLADGQSGERLQ